MRVLITGVRGALGRTLVRELSRSRHSIVGIDILPPPSPDDGDQSGFAYVCGSVEDRILMRSTFAAQKIDCVVHIAAFHGVHEPGGPYPAIAVDEYAFWQLNVCGTMTVFEEACKAGVRQFVHISTLSIPKERFGVYGHTKIIAEEVATTYAHRYPSTAVAILRPGAFIPSSDLTVYPGGLRDWAHRFHSRGGVHVCDVARCAAAALEWTQQATQHAAEPSSDAKSAAKVLPPVVVAVESRRDFSDADLERWDEEGGAGSTLRRVLGQAACETCHRFGLDPARKPRPSRAVVGEAGLTHSTHELFGWTPLYGLRELLEELQQAEAS